MKYHKFYNKEGKRAKIKFVHPRELESVKPFEAIIRFKSENDELWKYHSPKRKFHGALDIITYILKNLEHDKLLFEIL